MSCEDLGRDRYKRIIARCTVAGEDMGAWIVSQGLALAYRRYSLDYVDDEAGAQMARRGFPFAAACALIPTRARIRERGSRRWPS